MFRTATAIIALIVAAAFMWTTKAEAKGPFSLVIRGGDLAEAIHIDGPVQDSGMFGPQIAAPKSNPDVIYSVDFFMMSDHRSAGTISYYPAHDGIPAAWRTSYGFYSVPDTFNQTFLSYFPAREDDGTSLRWYALPGIGVGLLALGGGLGGRRFLSRRRA